MSSEVDYGSVYREPDWMRPPRGPDVSPQLRWYRVVTLFQLTLDMLGTTDAPIGYGHVYAPAHSIDAWTEMTLPESGLTPASKAQNRTDPRFPAGCCAVS